ncbi:hypothetical protein [Blastomonas sp.]|uniref:hypothetical protein n=1 Tax=Blastomonas sp. TaxID=1909299 RepID=UPI003593E56E
MALFAFDAQMASIVRGAREPMLAQIRLQWWLDVMTQPAALRPSANPVVAGLLPAEAAGVDLTAALGPVVRGWEALLAPNDAGAWQAYVEGRGQLFTVFDQLAGTGVRDTSLRLGRIWAAWSWVREDAGAADAQRFAISADDLAWLASVRLPRRLRPLSMLGRAALLDIRRARFDLPPGRPALFAALVWHGLTGW